MHAPSPQPELPKEQLTILGRDGQKHTFFVEVATTLPCQIAGLSHRRSLSKNGGMLFDWGKLRNNKMWMRDTFIPLDIIFIGAGGLIHRIAPNNLPESLEIVESKGLVRATLELLGGTVIRQNINVGDMVLHRIFDDCA